MIRALLIGLLLIGFASCKSIKKTKELQSVSMMQTASKMALDSSVFVLAEVAKQVEQEEVSETREQTFIPLDSAGLTIFKPVVIQKKTSRITRTADSTKNQQDIQINTLEENQSNEQISSSKDLDKSSEGQDPIESLTTALFPTWGKVLAAILTAGLPVVLAWWKKRNQT